MRLIETSGLISLRWLTYRVDGDTIGSMLPRPMGAVRVGPFGWIDVMTRIDGSLADRGPAFVGVRARVMTADAEVFDGLYRVRDSELSADPRGANDIPSTDLPWQSGRRLNGSAFATVRDAERGCRPVMRLLRPAMQGSAVAGLRVMPRAWQTRPLDPAAARGVLQHAIWTVPGREPLAAELEWAQWVELDPAGVGVLPPTMAMPSKSARSSGGEKKSRRERVAAA